MDPPAAPEPLTLTEALIPVASLVVLVGLSYYLFGDARRQRPEPGRAGRRDGDRLYRRAGAAATRSTSLRDAAIASVSSGMGAIFILFAVGALIGTWAMSGTLVAMVYYGLQAAEPELLLRRPPR